METERAIRPSSLTETLLPYPERGSDRTASSTTPVNKGSGLDSNVTIRPLVQCIVMLTKITDGPNVRPPRPSQSHFLPPCMSCLPGLFHGRADRVLTSPTEEDENDVRKEGGRKSYWYERRTRWNTESLIGSLAIWNRIHVPLITVLQWTDATDR